MVKPKPGATGCVALAVVLLAATAANAQLEAADQTGDGHWLLYGSLLSAYAGSGVMANRCYPPNTDVSYGLFGPSDMSLLTLGAGYGTERIGLILNSELVHVYATGHAGDYMISGSGLTTYLNVVSGLRPGLRGSGPVFHGFLGGFFWEPHGFTYVDIGAGVKWRWYAVSPGAQLMWRRIAENQSPITGTVNDVIMLGLKLELGGLLMLGPR